jgi:flagellar protein FlaG
MPDIALEAATRTLLNSKNTNGSQGQPEVDRSKESSPSNMSDRVVAPKEDAKSAIALVSEQNEVDESPPSKEVTREAAEKLQSYADRLDRNLEFSVDDSSGRTVVTVRDGSTEEVIRQIPSEEALRLANDVDNGGARLFDARA